MTEIIAIKFREVDSVFVGHPQSSIQSIGRSLSCPFMCKKDSIRPLLTCLLDNLKCTCTGASIINEHDIKIRIGLSSRCPNACAEPNFVSVLDGHENCYFWCGHFP